MGTVVYKLCFKYDDCLNVKQDYVIKLSYFQVLETDQSEMNHAFLTLTQNAALLVSLSVVYGLLTRIRRKSPLLYKALLGILFGFITIAGMNMPIYFQPGIIYDGRSVILILAGLFGGTTVVVISAVLGAAYRIYLGGAGIWAGLSTIALCAAVGLLFRKLYKDRPEEISAFVLWVIGLVSQIIMLLSQLLLPWPLGLHVIGELWVPVLLILPIGTLIIGLLFRTEDRRSFALGKIKESEKRYQTLSENSPVGIFRTRPDGYTTYVNPRWSELSGLSVDEAIGYGWIKAVHPDDRAELMKGWENATNSQINSNAEYRFLRADGQIIWVIGKAVSEFSDDGELIGYIGTISDITQRKLTEQALRDSEENYRNLFEKDSAIKLMLNRDTGNIINANKAAAQFYGWSIEVLKTMNIQQIRVNGYSEIPSLETEGEHSNIHFECQHRRADGSIRHIEIFTSKIRFKGKDCLHEIIHDVTEQKRAEEKLNLLSKAIEQGPASIMITDSEGKIDYINPKFTENTGYSFEEVLGKSPNILNSGEHSKEFYQQMWGTITSGKDWAGEIRNKKKTGEIIWESELISPIVDSNGNITNYISIWEDITEQKAMIKEVLAAKEKAEEAERLKSAFLANMSHEIRTPLNAILGFTSMITTNKELSREANLRYSIIINKSAEGLLQIINDILDISKLETGQVKVFRNPFDLNMMLERINELYQDKFRENKNKKLTFKHLPAPPKFIITSDENRLSQIFSNLLSNAFKFTEKGKIVFGVSDIFNDKIEFIVSDTGIGISPQDQKTIFERFRQANSSTKKVYSGNGLGLAIVKSLIELMGGKITFESELGKGTTFRFFLPIK